MKKLLIGGVALVASAAAIAQITPAPAPAAPAQRAPMAQKVETRAEVQAKVATMFARLDSNRDGFVTKAEADAAAQAMRGQWAERAKERTGEKGERTFERLDSNRDGAISRGEWDSARAQREQRVARRGGQGDHFLHGGMGGFGGHMFEMADSNRDGRVTLQEAQAAALKHFDMVDVNRDGQITPDERTQMRDRMRAERRG